MCSREDTSVLSAALPGLQTVDNSPLDPLTPPLVSGNGRRMKAEVIFSSLGVRSARFLVMLSLDRWNMSGSAYNVKITGMYSGNTDKAGNIERHSIASEKIPQDREHMKGNNFFL